MWVPKGLVQEGLRKGNYSRFIKFVIFRNFIKHYKYGMLLDCKLESLQRVRNFVSRCAIQNLISLTPLFEVFSYLVLLGANKVSNFLATSILWNYVQQPCTWDIKLLEVTGKRLELQLQLLNMSLRYFLVYPELHRN